MAPTRPTQAVPPASAPTTKSPIFPRESGTYALVLANERTGPIRIGKLSTLHLKPGVYVYIGSAFRPGGLAAQNGCHRQIRGPTALAHRPPPGCVHTARGLVHKGLDTP